MSDHGSSAKAILYAFTANLGIALAKLAASIYTHSGSMMAEAIHSFADCGNQVLLYVGLRQAQKPPDAKHPLGYGKATYFWSFIVALLLFFGGGVFSAYEGIHKLQHPEAVGDITVALIILAISLILEGWSTLGNIKTMAKRRGATGFFRYLRETKDSDLIVVFGENSAAVLGLMFALAAVGISKLTADGRWDAVGSLAIGLVLVGVATFLAREVKSLLVGEAADPQLLQVFEQLAELDPNVERVLNVLTLQQGPGEIVVAAKLKFRSDMDADTLVEAINAFERALKARAPEVRWSFIEPDNAD
jgi:cation diffusion facilitator family transporter